MKRVVAAVRGAQHGGTTHTLFNRKAVEEIHDFASSAFACNRRRARRRIASRTAQASTHDGSREAVHTTA